MTAMDFRQYDPAMGRFFNIDRLAEKYEAISPYAYVANNPIKFIDINGEWINIYDSGNKYRYMTGGQVQQWSSELGRWETVQMSEVSTYVATIIESIYELESSGATGAAVVGYFANDNRHANFNGYKPTTYANSAGSIYVQYGFKTNSHITVDGLQSTKIFITFGHELAHIIDKYENPNNYDDTWAKDSNGKVIKRSEIFATHIENQIRSQSGYPLRKYYGISQDAETGRMKGLRGTEVLDENNNSLYFRQTAPSIFDIQNRGEIINEKIQKIKIKDERYRY